jgi:hypothetical protein
LATQCPLEAQLSSGEQSLADLQAGMQLPVLPPTPQLHSPPGPQTIGCVGAASPMIEQSESALQGFCGIAQIPQPTGLPPGPHSIPFEQSALLLQAPVPASTGQLMLDSTMLHMPLSQMAVVAHPYEQ